MDGCHLWLLIGYFTLIEGAEIQNARTIVTGGANGIGYACAHDLLLEGAQMVAILDIDMMNGVMAAQKLNNEFGGNRAIFFPTDVSNPFRFSVDFYMAVQSMGGLDIMINNAGIADETIWRQMVDTNVKGLVQGTLMAFDQMGKHKGGAGGTVITMGSAHAFNPFKYAPIYVSTKLADLGFSRSAALSYNVTSVEVKTMCPGFTNTTLITTKAQRFLDFIDYNEALQAVANKPLLRPEEVATETMRLIREAPNGAVWVVEKNLPTISLNIPNYKEWGTPV